MPSKYCVKVCEAPTLTPRTARPLTSNGQAVADLCADLADIEDREVFAVLMLDGKNRLAAREVVSVGTLTSSLVHPRHVFRPAVLANAAAIVCVHNHPSGDPEPSAEDIECTRRLAQAGRLLGIPLLDHVVLGAGRHVSLRERGLVS